MLIELDILFNTSESRRQCAALLGRLVSVNDMEPYKPNENDDMYWTIDSGNDWKVQFFADHPKRIRVQYRYNCPNRNLETPFANWVAARYGGRIIGT